MDIILILRLWTKMDSWADKGPGGGSLSTINGSCPNNPRATKGNAYLHEAYIFKSIQQIMLIWFVELLCERCFAEVEGNPISRKIPD